MEVKNFKLSEVIPYEKNPRKNDNAVDAVMNSIKTFGFRVPIVIDTNNVIVCGHTHYKAAQKLELESVPCVVADDLTPKQIKAFRLADNKTAELAAWDFELLDSELSELFNDSGGGVSLAWKTSALPIPRTSILATLTNLRRKAIRSRSTKY